MRRYSRGDDSDVSEESEAILIGSPDGWSAPASRPSGAPPRGSPGLGSVKGWFKKRLGRGMPTVQETPKAKDAYSYATRGDSSLNEALGEGAVHPVANTRRVAWGEPDAVDNSKPRAWGTTTEDVEREASDRARAAALALADQYEAEAAQLKKEVQCDTDAALARRLQRAELGQGNSSRANALAGASGSASGSGGALTRGSTFTDGMTASRARVARKDAKKFWSSAAKKAARLGGVSTDYVRSRAAQDLKGRKIDSVDRKRR